MARIPTPQVVTANHLRQGHVVWLTATDAWSRALSEACVHHDPDLAQAALSRAQTQTGTVVGCYLAAVRVTPEGPEPTHFREEFRRDGPSPAARVPG